jgi:hypothetical protein
MIAKTSNAKLYNLLGLAEQGLGLANGNMISSYFNIATPNNTVNFAHRTLPQIKNNTVPFLRNTATILYTNYRPQNYSNYYFKNQKIYYDKFIELAPFASNMNNSSINALLQVYNTHIQDNINQMNSYAWVLP